MRGNSEDFRKDLGERLRRFRNLAGMSQRDLANKLELSHQQVQKYERGENGVPLEKLHAFADALGTTPGRLISDGDGWEAAETPLVLSSDRMELLRLYDALPGQASRERLLAFLKTLL